MSIHVVATILVGSLAALNLVLTLAVLRRLRQHTALLSGPPPGGEELVGQAVPEFVVTTRDGGTIGRADLAGREYLIGFFSTTCAPCQEQAPAFARLAEAHRGAALSVVVGDGPGADALTSALSGVPTAMVKPDDPIADDFGVRGFPTMMIVDAGGVVTAAGASARSLASSDRVTRQFA
jgi:thiol-disulfide isomerase/thioredoxin